MVKKIGHVMGPKCKTLYRGVFSYSRSVEKPIYRYAFTEKQAWRLMCDCLAKKHEVHPSHVLALFDGSKANFSIEIETEFHEKEGEEND